MEMLDQKSSEAFSRFEKIEQLKALLNELAAEGALDFLLSIQIRDESYRGIALANGIDPDYVHTEYSVSDSEIMREMIEEFKSCHDDLTVSIAENAGYQFHQTICIVTPNQQFFDLYQKSDKEIPAPLIRNRFYKVVGVFKKSDRSFYILRDLYDNHRLINENTGESWLFFKDLFDVVYCGGRN